MASRGQAGQCESYEGKAEGEALLPSSWYEMERSQSQLCSIRSSTPISLPVRPLPSRPIDTRHGCHGAGQQCLLGCSQATSRQGAIQLASRWLKEEMLTQLCVDGWNFAGSSRSFANADRIRQMKWKHLENSQLGHISR